MAARFESKKQKLKLAAILRGKLAAQRIRDRAKADAKISEKMPADAVPSHVSVDLEISNPENIEPESVENNELEKSDEICDKQRTGSVLHENDEENADTAAKEEVND